MRRLCLSMLLAGSLLFAATPVQADPTVPAPESGSISFENPPTDDGWDGDAISASTLGRT